MNNKKREREEKKAFKYANIDWEKHTKENIPEIIESKYFLTLHKDDEMALILWLELHDIFKEAISNKNEYLIERIFNEAIFYLKINEKAKHCYLRDAVGVGFLELLLFNLKNKGFKYIIKFFPRELYIKYLFDYTFPIMYEEYYNVLSLYDTTEE